MIAPHSPPLWLVPSRLPSQLPGASQDALMDAFRSVEVAARRWVAGLVSEAMATECYGSICSEWALVGTRGIDIV